MPHHSFLTQRWSSLSTATEGEDANSSISWLKHVYFPNLGHVHSCSSGSQNVIFAFFNVIHWDTVHEKKIDIDVDREGLGTENRKIVKIFNSLRVFSEPHIVALNNKSWADLKGSTTFRFFWQYREPSMKLERKERKRTAPLRSNVATVVWRTWCGTSRFVLMG